MEDKIKRIEELTSYLNECSSSYYNNSVSLISDAEYDNLFDELTALEQETGHILPDSPTQRAGYTVLSELQKIEHKIPLLSLAKTKSAADVLKMAVQSDGNLTLKIDGLTVKIVYENGKITEGSTRGDGSVGELITHNVKVFKNVPKTISYKGKLTVTGEAFIDIPTFEMINNDIENDEDKYATPRNLASGSVRQLDSRICAARGVKFLPFSVLEGFDDTDSKSEKLRRLSKLGFDSIPSQKATSDDTAETIEGKINELKSTANTLGYPIDGIVFTFDSVKHSREQGRTAHHFKDGIAYKFGDPQFKTKFNSIEWNISRTGQLTPIADFDTVEIDNTMVEKASLHNITFIESLKLMPGDEILVSKRNMIIPHIEKNITGENRIEYAVDYPKKCPVCGMPTVIKTTRNQDRDVKVLYCDNPDCAGKNIKKYTHFVSKSAMNIDGLSESTLEKFVAKGWINSLADIFSIPSHRDEIVKMEGFGEKSYRNLYEAIERSKQTNLSNFLVAINIPLLGKSAAGLIENLFEGEIEKFCAALAEKYDFSSIEGFGSVINEEIYKWFGNGSNRKEFEELLKIIKFNKIEKTLAEDNMFNNKTVVITGTFKKYTRDELSDILRKKGAKVTNSVSGKTDYLLCGEDAGSKLAKAEQHGVAIIYEDNLLL